MLLEGGFCGDLGFQGSLLGVGEYVVPMMSIDGLFFDGGFLAGGCKLTRLWMRCRVDVRGLVVLSGPGRRMCSPCWAAGFSFVV